MNEKSIIIFGEENSGKSSFLNKIADKSNLFEIHELEYTKEYAAFCKNKTFEVSKIQMEDQNINLYDTIGINPTYPVSDMRTKLSEYFPNILNSSFNLIFLTFDVYKVPLKFEIFDMFFSVFNIINNKNLFIVFTKGDKFISKEEKDEEYSTIVKQFKTQIDKKKYPIDKHNLIYYDDEHIDSIKSTIKLHLSDVNNEPSFISVKNKECKGEFLIKELEKLWTCKKELEEYEQKLDDNLNLNLELSNENLNFKDLGESSNINESSKDFNKRLFNSEEDSNIKSSEDNNFSCLFSWLLSVNKFLSKFEFFNSGATII